MQPRTNRQKKFRKRKSQLQTRTEEPKQNIHLQNLIHYLLLQCKFESGMTAQYYCIFRDAIFWNLGKCLQKNRMPCTITSIKECFENQQILHQWIKVILEEENQTIEQFSFSNNEYLQYQADKLLHCKILRKSSLPIWNDDLEQYRASIDMLDYYTSEEEYEDEQSDVSMSATTTTTQNNTSHQVVKNLEKIEHKIRWKTFGIPMLYFKIGQFIPIYDFEGQFRFKTDIIEKNFVICFFSFFVEDQHSATIKEWIWKPKLLQQFIQTELQQFKQSFVYKIVIPWNSITAIQLIPLGTPNEETTEEENLTLLWIQVHTVPIFQEKQIYSTTSLYKNQSRERTDFTTNLSASHFDTYFIVGQRNELEKLMYASLAMDESLRSIYKSSQHKTWNLKPSQTLQQRIIASTMFAIHHNNNNFPITKDKIDLLEMLQLKKEFLEKEDCFVDWIRNTSLKQIQNVLLIEESNQNQEIRNWIKNYNSEDEKYYSFCWNMWASKKEDFHCKMCQQCITREYTHCNACNRCSSIQPNQVCEWCGTSFLTQNQSNSTQEKEEEEIEWNVLEE